MRAQQRMFVPVTNGQKNIGLGLLLFLSQVIIHCSVSNSGLSTGAVAVYGDLAKLILTIAKRCR